MAMALGNKKSVVGFAIAAWNAKIPQVCANVIRGKYNARTGLGYVIGNIEKAPVMTLGVAGGTYWFWGKPWKKKPVKRKD